MTESMNDGSETECSEMTQRVGAKLRKECEAVFGASWSNDVAWRFARAAIEAMREPTQQMRLAGIAEWSRPDPTPEHESTLVFNAVYRAMIDAALRWPAGSADRAGVPLAIDQ